MRGNKEIAGVLQLPEITAFSIIPIAELLAGFKNIKKEQDHLKEFNIFLDSLRILIYGIDTETSEFYSKIYGELKKIGTPIPTNALRIASQTLAARNKAFNS